MLKKIKIWLANKNRKYSEGLAYFNKFASDKQKDSFGKYLNAVKNDDISQFDTAGRFPLLINQVIFIERSIKSSPAQYIASKTKEKPMINTEGLSGGKKDEASKVDKNSPNTNAVNAPKGDVNAPADAKQRAVTSLDQLPENFAPIRTRLKELVPYMAKVHADMAAELADDKRAVLRKELIALDDERRSIWKRIDKFLAGTPESKIEKEEAEKVLEQNMLVVGVDLAKRIGLLKSYIKRNTDSLKKHQAAGYEVKAASAQEKIDMYSKELAELEALLPKEQPILE